MSRIFKISFKFGIVAICFITLFSINSYYPKYSGLEAFYKTTDFHISAILDEEGEEMPGDSYHYKNYNYGYYKEYNGYPLPIPTPIPDPLAPSLNPLVPYDPDGECQYQPYLEEFFQM